jgi:GT2 family glycosyltransferase/SAM-dependent methyltransferase
VSYGPSDLTVVIPTRDRWDILRRTLDALGAQSVTGAEVAISVDGDDQHVPEGIVADHVLVARHAGPGAARNRAVAATRRPLLLFLGDDIIPTPRLIEHHLDLHRRNPVAEVAVLGHVRWHPESGGRAIRSWLDWSATQFDYEQLADAAHQDVGFGRLYSSNVSLKRTLFDRAGGFDPDFLYYYEDLDLGYRLGEQGMRLLYEPAAVGEHLHTYDLASLRWRFAGIAIGERLMADIHAWFDPPYFKSRIERAAGSPAARALWTHVVDLVPRGNRLRRAIERRANRWYLQQVADEFRAAWDQAGHLVELRRYLGDDFDASELAHAAASVASEVAAAPDEASFYRTSEAYLYDLTVFAMSGTKEPYLEVLRSHVPADARVLDVGCGIGADGLRLLELGYVVEFVDYDNPSTRYLRWRLEQRGLDAAVYDLERDQLPRDYDAAYAFDVVEHVDDPFAFLAQLEQRARLVIVNLLEDDSADHDHALHRSLPVSELVEHARQRGLWSHSVHHDRSHLLVYRGSAP